MALPVGVQTKTLSIGRGFDALGNYATLKIQVTPFFGGTAQRIVWSATGETFESFEVTPPAQSDPDGDTTESIDLPVVDQAGWADGSGNAVTAFAYQVTVTPTFGSGAGKKRMKPYTKFVSPKATDLSPIDMDKLPDGTAAAPTLAPPAFVTAEGLSGLVDAHLAANRLSSLDLRALAQATAQNEIDGGYVVNRRLGHPFWATPLSIHADIADTSADYVARLAYQAAMGTASTPVAGVFNAPFNSITQQGAFSRAIYVMPTTATRVPVYCTATTKTDLQAILDVGVPIPDPANISDHLIQPGGSDGSVIIISGDEAWEFWKFAPAAGGDPGGYAWRCQSGGYMVNYHKHPGAFSASSGFGGGTGGRPLGKNWGVAAAGLSYLAGTLTAEDYFGAVIRHPLHLSLPATGPGSILPATRFDAQNHTAASNTAADAYRISEGARFRLPVDFDIDGWVAAHAVVSAGNTGSTAPILKKILVCLRDYGLIVTDSSGVVAFIAEADKVYGSPYHPYASSEVRVWGNFAQQVPWSALVQLAPLTYDMSTPGKGQSA